MHELRIGLFYTSDSHSHIFPYRYADLERMPTGLARVSTCIEEHRSQYDWTLYIDNGDLIQGAPNSYYDAKISQQAEYPSVLAMNQMGCEAVVFGNHEFNYGRTYLDGAIEASQFPWLSANIVDEKSGVPYFGKPYIVRDVVPGLRLAVLGLTTKYIPNWENPSHIEGMAFVDPVDAALKWIPHLREVEKTDIVVVAYHGGLECDLNSGQDIEPITGENQGYELLKKVPGIDALLTGHQHREIVGQYGHIPVLQPGTEGRHVGVVEFRCEKNQDGWLVKTAEGKLIPSAPYDADPDILGLPGVDYCEQGTQSWLDESIGHVHGNLQIENAHSARLSEHPFIEFINRVQMWASGAEISAAALFDEDAKGFPKDISMREIISNYKYPNTLRVKRISGKAMREALEKCAMYFCISETGELEVHPDFLYPKPQHYNYDMWQGIHYTLNVSKPVGSRVQDLSCQGKPVVDTEFYEVVLNNYRASGGGNFDMLKDAEVVKDIPIDVSELIVNYIREQGTVEASCDYNWRVIQDEH